MRLWTLHPRYLDPPGLTAAWREALLARQVLLGRTRGYKHHPQLERFRAEALPVAAINSFLASLHAESLARGYSFDASKIGRTQMSGTMRETRGQLEFEWEHLLAKLRARAPARFRTLSRIANPESHALFRLVPGPVRAWEVRSEDIRSRHSPRGGAGPPARRPIHLGPA